MIALCLIALLVSIIVGFTKKVNIGCLSCVFAFLIATVGMGMRPSELYGLIPVKTLFPIICIMMFFGFALENGTLDLVMDNSLFQKSLTSHRIFQPERLLLAVPASCSINQALSFYRLPGEHIRRGIHLSDGIPPVPLEAFSQEPFIFLKPENDTRRRAMALCKMAGFVPHIVLELDQQVTAYNITSSGMGISFISDTLVQNIPPHPKVVYYKLDGPESQRDILFYWKSSRYVNKAMETFLDMACT